MAEPEGQTVEPQVPPVVDATVTGSDVPAPAPVAAPADDDEPGGDSPEAIFARKQYREAKQARDEARRVRDELEREKETRIRYEEQLRAKAEPEPKRVYTKAELDAAVLAGNIGQEDAEDYLFAQRYAKLRAIERQAEAATKPLERAQSEINEYLKLEPALRDGNSEVRQKADDEVERLIEYGYPRNAATKRQAIENVVGRIDTIRTRKETERATRGGVRPAPVDTSAGGNGSGGTGRVDLSAAPDKLQRMWNATGTSQADREDEYRHYLQRQKR